VSLLVLALALTIGSGGDYAARADEAPATEFRVVVHPDNPSGPATREFLADAFLKSATHWSDGEAIRAVDLKPDSPTRTNFSSGVLRRSIAAVRSYWQQRIFSGRDVPPPELDSDDAVVKYVLEHRGAVGYVSGAAKVRGAKVVFSK
jgi:ABC-type phosphate transport system substrate-binding protein